MQFANCTRSREANLLTNLLRLLPPELAHGLALRAAALAIPKLTPAKRTDAAGLGLRLWGRHLANPIGLAAGLDKDGVALAGLARLGFGAIEIGSVTPRPQPGNPRPRLFRLPEDEAVINRMGFNSAGHDAVRRRLARYRDRARASGPLIGVNLGKNRDSAEPGPDYATGIRAFAELADYLVVNISSPNTPGLRGLQAAEPLRRLLQQLGEARDAAPGRPPLLLKVAPDLAPEEREPIAECALAFGLDGLVIGNTTLARPTTLRSRHRTESGGLSGRPLFGRSTEVLADFRRLTQGRLPLIGVGGVASGADAYAKLKAGASLVQLYTALVYQGPGLIARIKGELAQLLRRDGFSSAADVVGMGERPASTKSA